MATKTYSLKNDGNKKISNNFSVKEFACKDGSDKIIIDDKLVEVLQKIRDHFGKSVYINSGYRNDEYNKKIGGVSNSQHTKGTACDIVVDGASPKEIVQYAEHIMKDYGGIGLYHSFAHIDVRKTRSRWENYGKEVVVNGFFGYQEKIKKPTMTFEKAKEILKSKALLEEKTIDFLTLYKYGEDLIVKLAKAMEGQQ